MKATITAILTLAGAATVAATDFPANMPDCGRTCGTNMLAKAAELGCKQDDIACLCNNKDFGFGIRDCSLQVCGDVNQANIAIGWGNSLCSGVGAPANIPTATAVDGSAGASGSPVTGGDSTATASASTGSGSGNGSGEGGDATAITTSTWTSTFTSGSETNTVTGETTISGIGGVAGATSVPETTITSAVVSTQTDGSETTLSTATITSSITGDALTSALESQASGASSASSSTSRGQGAQMTAAPALGVLAAAGIAVAFL
ncbi:hypothetical protein C8A01DRAFT_33131 [Parachaetomium inaequale]|uniref:CFEM domain-containing protein n=1 Tax=Parachaetomium inaequale TaxID=2588326 RepID=A0AAN6SUH6_9PEZI|nr:hypothetical protein C8A01DRAFT_33131 [Parachaetomium inaequale]